MHDFFGRSKIRPVEVEVAKVFLKRVLRTLANLYHSSHQNFEKYIPAISAEIHGIIVLVAVMGYDCLMVALETSDLSKPNFVTYTIPGILEPK